MSGNKLKLITLITFLKSLLRIEIQLCGGMYGQKFFKILFFFFDILIFEDIEKLVNQIWQIYSYFLNIYFL
jgi:hypothetical protein